MLKLLKGRLIFTIFAIVVMFGMTGCKNKQKKETAGKDEKKKIMMYVDVKDKHSLNIINFIIDEYKKENSNVEVDIKNPLDANKVSDDISKGEKADIVLTSRNTMLDLNKKGLLSDLSNFYTKNKMNDKFYNIMSSYGRIGDKYYGLGLIPYSLEFFYNSEALEKLKVNPPRNIVDVVPILKKLNEGNVKVPVLITEDIDIYNAFASILFSNLIELQKIENNYDSGQKAYKDLREIQWVFDNINLLVKQGAVNRDTAEMGTDNTMNRLVSGDIPLVFAISHYGKDIKEKKVGIIEDYTMSGLKETIPVIINCVICIPANSKNEEEVNNLMEFMVSGDIQKKLAKEGFVTGNKEANKDFKDINKVISGHIEKASNNSIVYVYSFPKKFQPVFESKIVKILSGKYNGNEWNEMITEMFK